MRLASIAIVTCSGALSIAHEANAQPATPAPPPPATTAPTTTNLDPTEPIPEQRISWDATLGGRINPLGLELQANVMYRHRLYPGISRIVRDNYFGIGLSPTISPAINRIGITAELRPFSMLILSGSVHHVGYIGSFDNLSSYERASADFSDTARDAGDKAGATYPTHGWRPWCGRRSSPSSARSSFATI